MLAFAFSLNFKCHVSIQMTNIFFLSFIPKILDDRNIFFQLEDDKVHEMLIAFKERHYSAKSMTLTIQSQHELDVLQTWVEESFSAVPNSGLPREVFDHLKEPFVTPEFHKIYKVCPVHNVYQLDMNWALPSLMDQFRAKPLSYLSWIIGHEGSVLKSGKNYI